MRCSSTSGSSRVKAIYGSQTLGWPRRYGGAVSVYDLVACVRCKRRPAPVVDRYGEVDAVAVFLQAVTLNGVSFAVLTEDRHDVLFAEQSSACLVTPGHPVFDPLLGQPCDDVLVQPHREASVQPPTNRRQHQPSTYKAAGEPNKLEYAVLDGDQTATDGHQPGAVPGTVRHQTTPVTDEVMPPRLPVH